MEGNISKLKEAIEAKLAPLKVAHTRLAQRSQRPNVELTRDPAQFQLVSEVNLIEQSISVSIAPPDTHTHIQNTPPKTHLYH